MRERLILTMTVRHGRERERGGHLERDVRPGQAARTEPGYIHNG